MSDNDLQEAKTQLSDLRDRLVRLESDRKWLLIFGFFFAAFWGVTNYVSVPAAAKREAAAAAGEEVRAQMPGIVKEKVAAYITQTRGIDFADALHRYLVEAETEKARAVLAAAKAKESQVMAETELQRMLGFGKGCILASPCPEGWDRKGTVGLIWEKGSGSSPFSGGADLNAGWNWIHPALCCKQ